MSERIHTQEASLVLGVNEQRGLEIELIRQFAVRELMSARTSIFGYALQALLLRNLVDPHILWLWCGSLLLFEVINGVLAWKRQSHLQDDRARRRLLMALSGSSSRCTTCVSSVLVLPWA